ncbi:hypothetical protein PM082_006128 [Marasmius tenuissimus]|nr:hypothetical protein PM082_006128 [Marasmius tenuissimus]
MDVLKEAESTRTGNIKQFQETAFVQQAELRASKLPRSLSANIHRRHSTGLWDRFRFRSLFISSHSRGFLRDSATFRGDIGATSLDH